MHAENKRGPQQDNKIEAIANWDLFSRPEKIHNIQQCEDCQTVLWCSLYTYIWYLLHLLKPFYTHEPFWEWLLGWSCLLVYLQFGGFSIFPMGFAFLCHFLPGLRGHIVLCSLHRLCEITSNDFTVPIQPAAPSQSPVSINDGWFDDVFVEQLFYRQ